MPREQKQVRELQEGSYVMMDDSPCKINHYSTLEAEAWFGEGRRCRGRDLVRAIAAFPWLYLAKSGWRDGIAGLAVSGGQSFYALLRCLKMWELTCGQSGRRASNDDRPGS